MSDWPDDFDDDNESSEPAGFFRRYRVPIIVIGVLLGGVVALARLASNGGGSSRHDSITIVSLPPPPPPPPSFTPPPPPPQQEEQKMEQPMIKEDQPKAAEPPKDEPPIGTGIKGDGPADSFGLGGGPGQWRPGQRRERQQVGMVCQPGFLADSSGLATKPQDSQRQYERQGSGLAGSHRQNHARPGRRFNRRPGVGRGCRSDPDRPAIARTPA